VALSHASGKFRSNNHGCKNWLDDPQLNCTSTTAFKDSMKIECLLIEDNYDLIEEADFFKQLEVDDN
jgi:hypothetical protein